LTVQIRKATPQDIPIILEFINELAVYEKLEHEVVANKETLTQNLFGPTPFAEVILLDENKKSAGLAIFFHNFSTFLGRPGIYLEDLFVKPEYRGKGYGKQLLAFLAQLTVERNCGRLEWSVLDWNQPALDFYKSVGATPMQEWTVQRLTGDSLKNLAKVANLN
jgi:GNAT superfamily N-acetyltransferase